MIISSDRKVGSEEEGDSEESRDTRKHVKERFQRSFDELCVRWGGMSKDLTFIYQIDGLCTTVSCINESGPKNVPLGTGRVKKDQR